MNPGDLVDGEPLHFAAVGVGGLGHPGSERVRHTVGRDLPVDALHDEELSAEHGGVVAVPEHRRHHGAGVLAELVHHIELAAHVIGGEHGARIGLRCRPDHQAVGGPFTVFGPLCIGQDRLAGHAVGAGQLRVIHTQCGIGWQLARNPIGQCAAQGLRISLRFRGACNVLMRRCLLSQGVVTSVYVRLVA
ncbi:Uncharacterised protein [Mycobacteroides abscessus subsp. abscessus]|nr:Uncharacterised protein [Mycobacteroides abscessus subsp. abscessus]